MKLEMNIKRSCGPGSRHIDIRYFFMKNRLDTENINVVYCPTEDMLADLYTKPLQDNLFRKCRDMVMGLKHISTLKRVPILSDQEHVVNNVTLKSNNFRNILKDESANIATDSQTVQEIIGEDNDVGKDKDQSAHKDIIIEEVKYDAVWDISIYRISYAEIVKSSIT